MLCSIIKVRLIIQTSIACGPVLENNKLMQETAENGRFVKACFPMTAFGSTKQTVVMLWGSDRLVIKGLKHLSGIDRGFVKPARERFDEEERTATFIYAVTDITLLRHRRSVDFLVALDLGRFLNSLAKDLLQQDLDEVFVRVPHDADVNLRGKRNDLIFQAEEFHITRPLPAATAAAMVTTAINAADEDCPLTVLLALPTGSAISAIYDFDSFANRGSVANGQLLTETRTLSARSLASDNAEHDEEKPDAKRFLMSTAKRSLDEAFGLGGSEKAMGSDSKKKDKKKKALDDSAATFGLAKKDMLRTMDYTVVSDLEANKIAFVLSSVTPAMIANDLFELGGELESLLRDRAVQARKNRAKTEHNEAMFQADKSEWSRKLDDILKEHRTTGTRLVPCLPQTKAATEDLKKTIKASSKESKDSKGSKDGKDPRDKHEAGKKKRKPAPKECPGSENDDDDDAKEEEEEEDDTGSPTGAPYMDSASEPEPGPEEDDENEDADIFQGDFKPAAPTATTTSGSLEKLPAKFKHVLERFDSGILDSLPKELSQTDLGHWILVLDKECLHKPEHFQLGLEGPLSTHISAGKSQLMKMSLRVMSTPTRRTPAAEKGSYLREGRLTQAEVSSILDNAYVLTRIATCSLIRQHVIPWLNYGCQPMDTAETQAALRAGCNQDQRPELLKRMHKKLELIDSLIQDGKPVGEIEDALAIHRQAAARQLLPLRPRIFQEPEVQEAAAIEDATSSETASPGVQYTDTEILYLRSETQQAKGVLQVHKVPEECIINGYRFLLRAEEIWSLTKRAQQFTNWYTKLQDGLGLDVADAWKIDVNQHMVRKATYKGSLKISRGCVSLESWRSFLEHADMVQWRTCRLLAKEEQNIDTGIGVAVAAWFILRAAERALPAVVTNQMPPLQADFKFHPATKDGRKLRGDCKPRAELAIDRFISRGGGFCSSEMDTSLKALGLETTSDFMCRYTRKTEVTIKEALAKMTMKSLGVLCDSSPMAKMVWLPLLSVQGVLSVGTLQRLSTLLPSTATAEEKQQVAAMVADSRSSTIMADPNKKAELKKPKALSAIKQDRLSSRQELKALMNILSHVGISMEDCWPRHPLVAANPERESRILHKVGALSLAYIFDRESGTCRWDTPMSTDHLRLVICPDQGGPMFCCYQYLAHNGASVALVRDENDHFVRLALQGQKVALEYLWIWLHPRRGWNQARPDDVLMDMFQRDILKENDLEETADSKLNFTRVMEILGKTCKWCSFSHTAKRFQMSATLLLILWSAMEVGKNPFKILDDEGPQQNQKSYDKTVDLCVKALTNELSFGIFRVARNMLEPFRELCLELVIRLKFRRGITHEDLLRESFGLYLSTVHELLQYTLYLRSSPHCAAGLISEKDADNGSIKEGILTRMKDEWQTVLEMEAKPASAVILTASCHHTRYQHYREIMTCLEKHEFRMTAECKDMVSAWNPAFCQSASLESMFGDMSDAVKRSGRSDCGGLASLHAVGVRSLMHRVCRKPESPKPVELVKEAVGLKELPYKFAGALPEQQEDETRVPCKQQADFWDPLGQGVSTPALALDVGRCLIKQLRFGYDDVVLCGYSLHVCEKALEEKSGSCILMRRGATEYSLLCYLVQTQQILQTASASLSELLMRHDVQMAKSSTKNQKVRRLLMLPSVTDACDRAVIERILAKLDEQEEKRKKRSQSKEEEQQDDEGDEIQWAELCDDPATAACRELLERMDEAEEKEDTNGISDVCALSFFLQSSENRIKRLGRRLTSTRTTRKQSRLQLWAKRRLEHQEPSCHPLRYRCQTRWWLQCLSLPSAPFTRPYTAMERYHTFKDVCSTTVALKASGWD
ncbi:unnamed protein product [Symbiodinium sp. CCMP2592]|nr:unnamed protein product [Symbiodinium sp. CCMP2592]